MSGPASIAGPGAAAVPGAGQTDAAAGHRTCGSLGDQPARLLASDSAPDQPTCPDSIRQRIERHRTRPQTAAESQPAHRFDGRIRSALNELSAYSNKGIMGRMRALASAIRRLFTSTHPVRQQQPAAGRSPYDRTMEMAIKRGSSRDSLAIYGILDRMDRLHSAVRAIPQLSSWIENASCASLRRELAGEGMPLVRIYNEAVDTATNISGEIEQLLESRSDTIDRELLHLAQHIRRTAAELGDALDMPYEPTNERLAQQARGLRPEFWKFADSRAQSYTALSGSSHFTKADDLHLRAWMNQGLQVIAKASQVFEAAAVRQDTSLSVSEELAEFRRMGTGPAA